MSLPSATWAESTVRCEGSHFGFVVICIPFPNQCSPSPYHLFLQSATPTELTKRCEGSHFGFVAIAIPFPNQLLTISFPYPYQVPHEQIWHWDARGVILGLLPLTYHFLTNCLPSPYHFLIKCHTSRIDNKMWGESFWGCCHLHTIS